MSRANWQPSVGDLVICYTVANYGTHGVVSAIVGRMATVKLVSGKTVECHFFDLSPR